MEEEEPLAEGVYQVEKIVGQAMINGIIHYRVKWQGFSSAEDTWEPVENLEGCNDLLAEFLAKEAEKEKKKEKKRAEEEAKAKAKEEKERKQKQRRVAELAKSLEEMKSSAPVRITKAMEKPSQEPLNVGEQIVCFIQTDRDLLVRCTDGKLKQITREQAKQNYTKQYLQYLENQAISLAT